MGIYVNPGRRRMEMALNEAIFIDKSMILSSLNKRYDTSGRFVCVSRPRRFGKTMASDLITAYYSKGADSRAIFEKLDIAQTAGWDSRLNRSNVISLDMNAFWGRYKKGGDVAAHLTRDVVAEMMEEFPDAGISPDWPLSKSIISVYKRTGDPFVIIVDEYDAMVRERVPQREFEDYLTLLNDLFKSADCSEAISLAYLTGIIPIVRDRVQSKLNNFVEFTMISPQELAPYFGFTLAETRRLCEKAGMNFSECLRWYDGYHIAPGASLCNPNSVCRAISAGEFDDYWTQTGAYTAISDYISMDFDGVKEDIATMIGGGSVAVNVTSFTNTIADLSTKDKVFTYLIHLGYLAYDKETETCSIPNGEIRKEWKNAIEGMDGMGDVFEMVRNSNDLLAATLSCDEVAVAKALDKAHGFVTSAKTYNNEGALQAAVGLAYFSASSRYSIVREMPGGKGFADLALIPLKAGSPAIIIELKMRRSPESALAQIKERRYTDALRGYKGSAFLVGVSYDKETREHTCKIKQTVID